MKVNPNDPAMPHRNHDRVSGTSIRTELAARAMEGLLAKDGWAERIMSEKPDTTKALSIQIAAASVRMADLLITELNKPTE